MSERAKGSQGIGIGALARATGIPVETLRTWERRYGFPEPNRTQSGHRRYSLAVLERLHWVRAALQRGHRASVVLGASPLELQRLIAYRAPRGGEQTLDHDAITRCVELIRRFDGRALERELHTAFSTLGAPAFLAERAGPLLAQLGERWSRGELGIRHEHFASARLAEFLMRQWQPLSDIATGPCAVCATLAGEAHALGLHMVALTLALNNVRVVYLGADLPAREISDAVAQHGARALLLSAAAGTNLERARTECAALRAALGPPFPILVGGAGFENPPTNVTRLGDLTSLDRWARSFVLGKAPN